MAFNSSQESQQTLYSVYRLYATEFNMQHLFRYQTDISDNLPSKLLKRISIPMKTRASAGLNGN